LDEQLAKLFLSQKEKPRFIQLGKDNGVKGRVNSGPEAFGIAPSGLRYNLFCPLGINRMNRNQVPMETC
jgi:hypothetical protein